MPIIATNPLHVDCRIYEYSNPNHMKKIYLLLSLFIFIVGCEKDDNSIIENETEIGESNISSNFISGKEIPDIIKLISPQSNSASKSSLVATPIG